MTRPKNIFIYFMTEFKKFVIRLILSTQRNLVRIELIVMSDRILTKGAIEHAIHEWKEGFKQRRLHKVMTMQHISHYSTNVMRRICPWTERSVRVWRRNRFQ